MTAGGSKEKCEDELKTSLSRPACLSLTSMPCHATARYARLAPLRKERNAKSGAAGNRKIARTKSRMARVFRSQKGQARLQRESRPFPRHREEGVIVAR